MAKTTLNKTEVVISMHTVGLSKKKNLFSPWYVLF